MFGPYDNNQQSQVNFSHLTDSLTNFFDEHDENHSVEINILKNCNYVELNDFLENITNNKYIFSTISQNIRSLSNKWNDFTQLIDDFARKGFSFTTICLQEIWSINPAFDPSLQGYSPLIHKVRDCSGFNNNVGGGVGIYINNDYKYEILESISEFIPREFESIFVKVYINEQKYVIVGSVYRPPHTSINNFNIKMENILNNIFTHKDLKNFQDIVINGDFNIDLSKINMHTQTSQFLDLFTSNHLFPVISKPTRICQSSATIIDNIFTYNINSTSKSGILLESLSDHCPIFYLNELACNKTFAKPIACKKRLINAKTKAKFEDLLLNENWTDLMSENRPEHAFSMFFNKINRCHENAFPFIETKPTIKNTPINPWMTAGLLKSRKRKQQLYAKQIKNPTSNNINKFKVYCNEYKKLCRAQKKLYYSNKIDQYKNDSKKQWETINSIIGKVKDKGCIPDYFIEKGELIKGDLDIAEGFNTFFSQIGPELSNKCPSSSKSYTEYLKNKIDEDFVFSRVTPDLLEKVAKQLKPKTSAGLDNISSKQLKDILPIIVEPICHIFNLSLQTGYIPKELKTAKVVPIYKSDLQHSFNNYRPISLLPSLSKLLEKIVARQMISFIDKHKILYDLQFGFRKKHNTTHPVLHFLDKIYKGLNQNDPQFTIAIFLDLKKAFDTTCHSILLNKLKHYGFRGLSNLWFTNYLYEREQVVTIHNVNSRPQYMTVGVPQGSILGPLLFLLYINCLPNATSFFTLLFADDTTFQLSNSNIHELYKLANTELKKASEWFICNKLTLNVAKTKYITFCPKNCKVNLNDFTLHIGEKLIDRIGEDLPVKSFKFVGLNIDENLSWKHHINKIKSKLAYINLLIGKCKYLLPTKVLIKLYNALYKPHLEFGILAWGTVPYNQLKGIVKSQKKCIRNIANKKSTSHTEPLFKEHKILKVIDIFIYNCKSFMYDFVNENCPSSFETMFKRSTSERTRNVVIEKCRNKFLSRFPTI